MNASTIEGMLALCLLLAAVGASDTPLTGVDGSGPFEDGEEACAPPLPGFLTLDTAPWTLVYVDGEYVGSTPLFRHPLPPGAHTLKLVNEGAGVSTSEDVVVEEGRARKLKMLLAHFDATTTLDDSRRTEATAEDCLVPAEDAAWLSIDTQPWSQVFIDGKRLGSTPIFRAAIHAGDHVVRLVRADGKQAFARFAADAGELVKLAVALGPAPDPDD